MSLKLRGKKYSYKFQWSLKTEHGREIYHICRSAHTGNKRKAEDAEGAHREALRLGKIHPLDPWPIVEAPVASSLREFSKRFLAYVRNDPELKASTVAFYERCLRRVLRFAPLADMPLSAAHAGELIGKFAAWRKANEVGNSVPTINGELRTLRRLFNVAREMRAIPVTPVIHAVAGEKGRDRVIRHAEELRYLAKASATLRDAATLAADTGLRPNSELFPLESVNVHVEPSQNAPHGFLHVVNGKTDSAVRNIPLRTL